MIEQSIKKWLTKAELKKVTKVDDLMTHLERRLSLIWKMEKQFKERIETLRKEKILLLERPRREQLEFQKLAVAKGECPREIKSPVELDACYLKCPKFCPFLQERVVGYTIEINESVDMEYNSPTWGPFCIREKNK